MVTVVKPRLPGQPIHCAIRMNSISIDMPVITSGMISGAVTKPEKIVLPRNRPKRASAIPAMVPRMVAIVALTSAISSDRIAALMTCRLSNSFQYHSVENPPQTVESRDLLNEKKIIEKMGT